MANLIIDGTTTTLYGVQTYDVVQIINGGTLDVQAYDGIVGTGTIEIRANSILIDATSRILGDARGFRGSPDASRGEGPGGGIGTPGSGAGYGGNGGGTNGQPGMAYGTESGTDIERGSGGGCGYQGVAWGLGGNGGGFVALYATTIEIAGTISSNGGIGISASISYPHFVGSGGGSGGGILLSGDTIIVSGTLSANGAPGSDALDWYISGGDGGAGGRIKLFPSSAITFTGTETVIGGPGGASVGPGPGLPGENGTVYHAVIPTTGDVCIKSNPSGASITIDGTPHPKTTAMSGTSCIIDNIVIGLTPGTNNHSYEINLTGYEPKTGTFSIAAGMLTEIDVGNLALIPTTGDVCIKSNPSGASITIDGILQSGKITATSGTICILDNTIVGLTPGTNNRSYEINLAGYQPKSGIFSIIAGTLTEIDVGNLVLIPVSAGSGGFALLSLGLLFGLILIKKKCEDKHTKEECEQAGCQWKDGRCIEIK